MAPSVVIVRGKQPIHLIKILPQIPIGIEPDFCHIGAHMHDG